MSQTRPSIIGSIAAPNNLTKPRSGHTPPDSVKVINTGNFRADPNGNGCDRYAFKVRRAINENAKHHQITPEQYRELIGWL